jgi:hypothetical protein
VDKFIYPLRKAFPLVADGQKDTQTLPGVPIEAIEARNVLDGRKLVAQMQASGRFSYPFGLPTPQPVASAAEQAALDHEANRLLDAYDAVAELALAEGVHQAVQGNFERLAGTLETYSTGNFPPDPEIVRTPAGGVNVTHRVAVHLVPDLPQPAGPSMRAAAEPALDEWLGRALPPLDRVQCNVTWIDPLTRQGRRRFVSLQDIGLRPIDVIALVRPDDAKAMAELDDRVSSFVRTTEKPRSDASLSIAYREAPADKISIFATSALVRTLRAIVSRSRPLRATDALLQRDVTSTSDTAGTIDPTRISVPLAECEDLVSDFKAYLASLDPLVSLPVPNRAVILARIDDLLDGAVGLLERAARFGLPQAGWGFLLEWKRSAFADLVAAVGACTTRWADTLARYKAKLDAYQGLPGGTSDTDRFEALRVMELLVSTTVAPQPATPADLLATVNAKAEAFQKRREQLVAATETTDSSFANLLAAVSALRPLSAFDTQPLTVTSFGDRTIAMAQDLDRTLSGHQAALEKRIGGSSAAMDQQAGTTDPKRSVDAVQRAAQALFGDEFSLYPQFALSADQAAEWANAYGASTKGALLQYLINTAQLDLPVDEWLAGIARVRPALHAWESAANLSPTLGAADLPLTPVQFPFVEVAPWVAMQYDPAYVVDREHLLYTAQYPPGGFDQSKAQCGLLLDEWTEVIPSRVRTAGLAFQYDRPNSEAPQSILIVTPATLGERWQWEDLIGALNETLDLAKKRALEPSQIDPFTYARFLPATITASTTYAITISATLAAANGVYGKLQ